MMFAPHRLSAAVLAVSLTAFGLTAVALAVPAAADGPGSGVPWVATLGDSYVSGEAGRWAGSSNVSTSYADALGSTAYLDNASNTAEQIRGCHRSKSQESYIGGGMSGVNLACSGAKAATEIGIDGNFKPGLDFSDYGAGDQGQAKLLQTFATTHNVKMVVVGIGGNDFDFAAIVASCVSDFLLSPSWLPNYCNDDPWVTANFTASNVSAVQARIVTRMRNVRTAMRNAGYADLSWSMVVQKNTVGLYEEKGLTSWQQAGAVDKTEWLNQIRTVSTVFDPYYIQESLHPNYWAQMGLRSCVRQVWNSGAVRGGSCAISGTGLIGGEPRMTLS